VQVKCTYNYGDWLVGREFNVRANSVVVALVRLGKESGEKPELFFLQGNEANRLITHKYKTHSPRISHRDAQEATKDHDLGLVKRILESS
jgi:hypothetical protein